MSKYLWNILVGIDMFCNTLLGGDPRETLSSRIGKRQSTSKIAKNVCTILDTIDSGHCNKNIDATVGDRELI